MRKKQQTVVLDLDDTLCVLKDPMCASLNKFSGKILTPDDFHKFDICDIYGISDQDLFDCLINDNILENLIPYPETKPLLTDLIKKGYNVTVITSRAYHPEGFKVTLSWFTKYAIPFTRLVVSEYGKKKSDYITDGEEVALFLDDRIENCEDFIASGKAKEVHLYDMPWNKNSSLPRIKSLSEVRSLLKM